MESFKNQLKQILRWRARAMFSAERQAIALSRRAEKQCEQLHGIFDGSGGFDMAVSPQDESFKAGNSPRGVRFFVLSMADDAQGS